jgi:hypothetical protein
MTALAALSRTDRQCLLERLAELMGESSTLAEPGELVPLHRCPETATPITECD